jgi:hypothetical protein
MQVPLNQKSVVGSCIVHATQNWYRAISVIQESESQLPGQSKFEVTFCSARAYEVAGPHTQMMGRFFRRR